MHAPTEVRRLLEGEMVALAAERATRAQVATMRRALKAIDRAAAAGQDGVLEDLAFHRTIGESAGNPQFRLLLGFLEQYLHEGMSGVYIQDRREAEQVHAFDALGAKLAEICSGVAAVARDPARTADAERHRSPRRECGGGDGHTSNRRLRRQPGVGLEGRASTANASQTAHGEALVEDSGGPVRRCMAGGRGVVDCRAGSLG